MIIDASVVLAILLNESDGASFKRHIATAPGPHAMSPINYLEAAVRVDKLPVKGKSEELDNLVAALDIKLAAITGEQAYIARKAYKTFGKGFHPARLNLGDCFAYALSKARDEPLLFKGNDFRLTDVEAAV
jgi:ribonuclease VapC